MTVEIKLSSLTVNVFESAIINHPQNQILHCLMWPWHAPGSPRRHVCTDNSLSALLLLFNMSHDLLFRCKARVVFQNVTNGKHPEKHRLSKTQNGLWFWKLRNKNLITKQFYLPSTISSAPYLAVGCLEFGTKLPFFWRTVPKAASTALGNVPLVRGR